MEPFLLFPNHKVVLEEGSRFYWPHGAQAAFALRALFTSLLGLLVFATMFSLASTWGNWARLQSDGASVTGRVLEANPIDGGEDGYDVTYAFEVGGKTYRGSYHADNSFDSSRPVTVTYSRSRPEVSTLEARAPAVESGFWLLMALCWLSLLRSLGPVRQTLRLQTRGQLSPGHVIEAKLQNGKLGLRYSWTDRAGREYEGVARAPRPDLAAPPAPGTAILVIQDNRGTFAPL